LPDAVKNLLIGDVLQLQYAPPSENQDRYAVKLIGFLPGQSLVISTPRKQGKAILVREGQAFTVRLLQGSNVFGFVAKVLNIYSRPYPHLHLAYPEDVESAVVRNAPRVPANLSAMIHNTSEKSDELRNIQALVVDLSSTGARLLCQERLGAVGDMLQISLILEVCGGEDRLQVLGAIRSIRESDGIDGVSHNHGIQFAGLHRFQQLLLCSYVLGRIVKERG
jgi:c-di-GMP-binding flagellar brake protein YcgR